MEFVSVQLADVVHPAVRLGATASTNHWEWDRFAGLQHKATVQVPVQPQGDSATLRGGKCVGVVAQAVRGVLDIPTRGAQRIVRQQQPWARIQSFTQQFEAFDLLLADRSAGIQGSPVWSRAVEGDDPGMPDFARKWVGVFADPFAAEPRCELLLEQSRLECRTCVVVVVARNGDDRGQTRIVNSEFFGRDPEFVGEGQFGGIAGKHQMIKRHAPEFVEHGVDDTRCVFEACTSAQEFDVHPTDTFFGEDIAHGPAEVFAREVDVAEMTESNHAMEFY